MSESRAFPKVKLNVVKPGAVLAGVLTLLLIQLTQKGSAGPHTQLTMGYWLQCKTLGVKGLSRG